MKKWIVSMMICAIACLATVTAADSKPWEHGDLRVSENQRFLVHEDGTPFFLLGETPWLMPQRLNRDEIAYYMQRASEAEYNMVQVQVLNAVPSYNAYGQSSKDEGYWQLMDYMIGKAGEHGMYVGMVCIWGNLVKDGLMTVEEAREYGTFLANRYKDCPNIIWIIGGDIQGNVKTEVWEMLATTIKGIDKRHLMTYHPRGRYTSAKWWSKAGWMDFHCFQSGHRKYGQRMGNKDYPIPDNTEEDNWQYVDSTWAQKPIKPVIDDEPIYENITIGLHDKEAGTWKAADVRRYAYWSVFAGSCGHTYGHTAIMQFYRPGLPPAYYCTEAWYDALNDPGFNQMKYLKRLMLSLPYLERIPDQSVIMDNGTRYDRLIATRGKDYMLVYDYTMRDITLDLTKITGKKKRIYWMNAATGEMTDLGIVKDGIHTFRPKDFINQKDTINDGVLIAIDFSQHIKFPTFFHFPLALFKTKS